MREIKTDLIISKVKNALINANCIINPKVLEEIKTGYNKETSTICKEALNQIIINDTLAQNEMLPICQDTGIVVCFLEIGYETHINGDIYESINEGIRQGYNEGYLRKSVVGDPLNRINTNDNTPAIFHTKMVSGDKIKIILAPKGAGSENMSKIKMLKPSDGENGVIDFVIETVKLAGGKPCPPIIVGVGIGGNFEKCAILAKEALVESFTNEPQSELEKILKNKINDLKIGAMGLHGDITCLSVKVKKYPCHIASLPVAVNIQCHVHRDAEVII